MPVDEPEFLPTTRTVRYKTEDPISALKLKVVLQVEDPETQEQAEWVRKERVFTWQEKVFGLKEFEKYKNLAENHADTTQKKGGGLFGGGHRQLTPLERKYISAMDHVPEGEILFSYVDTDDFDDQEKFVANMTTAQSERPTALSETLHDVDRRRGRHSQAQGHFRVMFIMAQLKAKREGVDVTEEHVLCRARYYNDGRLDLTPGFSPRPLIKVDVMRHSHYEVLSQSVAPYRIRTAGGFGYLFWITNDTEPTDRSKLEFLNAKSLRFHQDLYDKAAELRRNFVGDEFEVFSETPEQHSSKVLLNLEIVSGEGFEDRSLYVHYLLQIPKGWSCNSEHLEGNTHLSFARGKKFEGQSTNKTVAHWGHPIEVEMMESKEKPLAPDMGGEGGREKKPNQDGAAVPMLLLQVNSYDQWDRQRVQGYCSLALPLSTTSDTHVVHTWAPALSQVGRMRSFFVGGTPELRNLSLAGIPHNQDGQVMSRFGFATVSSGSVTVRVHAIRQGVRPPWVAVAREQARMTEGRRAAGDKLRASAQVPLSPYARPTPCPVLR